VWLIESIRDWLDDRRFQNPDPIEPTKPKVTCPSLLTADEKVELKRRLYVAHLMQRDLERYGDL
jgi:hypothetical protein